MANSTVKHIRIPDNLLKKALEVSNDEGFTGFCDYVRHLIHNDIKGK